MVTMKSILLAVLLLPACGNGDSTPGDWFPPPPDAGPKDFVFGDSEQDFEPVDHIGAPGPFPLLTTAEDNVFNDLTLELRQGQGDRMDELHAALADDLVAAGLTPCERARCYFETAAIVAPDTLRVDLMAPAGVPNGRRLEDPALDIVLAAILLDITEPGTCGAADCSLTTFADLPLNPPQNDVPFSAEFPFLASPHLPE